MTPSQATRYLGLLGLPAHSPSLAALTQLVAAHLSRIPFENVSKLIQHVRGGPPVLVDLDRFLDLIEHVSLGGTCYACGSHFNALLAHLGYDAGLCGATMSRPDVHAVNIVRLEERDYLVDVGYGAPLFTPLPLDTETPITVTLGPDRYVLHPRDENHHPHLDHLHGDTVIHGYTIDPTPRDPDYFAPEIARSFRPESEFLNRLCIVRHRPGRSISLSDFTITVTEGDVVRTRVLSDRDALRDVVEIMFQIPGRMTEEAMAALDGRSKAWS